MNWPVRQLPAEIFRRHEIGTYGFRALRHLSWQVGYESGKTRDDEGQELELAEERGAFSWFLW